MASPIAGLLSGLTRGFVQGRIMRRQEEAEEQIRQIQAAREVAGILVEQPGEEARELGINLLGMLADNPKKAVKEFQKMGPIADVLRQRTGQSVPTDGQGNLIPTGPGAAQVTARTQEPYLDPTGPSAFGPVQGEQPSAEPPTTETDMFGRITPAGEEARHRRRLETEADVRLQAEERSLRRLESLRLEQAAKAERQRLQIELDFSEKMATQDMNLRESQWEQRIAPMLADASPRERMDAHTQWITGGQIRLPDPSAQARLETEQHRLNVDRARLMAAGGVTADKIAEATGIPSGEAKGVLREWQMAQQKFNEELNLSRSQQSALQARGTARGAEGLTPVQVHQRFENAIGNFIRLRGDDLYEMDKPIDQKITDFITYLTTLYGEGFLAEMVDAGINAELIARQLTGGAEGFQPIAAPPGQGPTLEDLKNIP